MGYCRFGAPSEFAVRDVTIAALLKLAVQLGDIYKGMVHIMRGQAKAIKRQNPIAAKLFPARRRIVWLLESRGNEWVIYQLAEKENARRGPEKAACEGISSDVLANSGMQRLVLRRAMEVGWEKSMRVRELNDLARTQWPP